MKNNFADWELTQLLPIENPYASQHDNEQIDWYIDTETSDTTPFIHIGESLEDWYKFLRNAWGWEDIRLYLLSKGYVVTYDVADNDYSTTAEDWYLYCPRIKGKIDENFTNYYTTYKEARREAIVYCLNLIKNEKSE